MVTSKLRTVLFALACGVLGWGLFIILSSIIEAPPENPDAEAIEAFLETMIPKAGTGLVFEIVGAFLTLVIVLWNASALNKDWLQVMGYGFKAFGVLTGVLLIALVLRQYQLHRVAESHRAEERLNRLSSEASDAVKTRNRDQVQALLANFAAWWDKPAVRNAAVAVAGSQLRDDDAIPLGMVQALYSVCLHDPDPEVRKTAREVVFPEADGTVLPTDNDFAKAVVKVLGQDSALLKQVRYQRYALLLKERYRPNEPALIDLARIEDASVSLPTASTDLAKSSLSAQNTKVATKEDTAAVRDVIVAATSTSGNVQDNAIKVLDEANGPRLKATIKSLPAELQQSLPPRVYLHVAEESDRAKLTAMSAALRQTVIPAIRGGRTIVPGIQVVGKRAPATTEVRYFAGEDSRKIAADIARFLTDQKIKSVRISQERASAEDLKRDVAGHFEIWFAKGALD